MPQTEAATLMTSSGISMLTGVPHTSVIHYSNIGVALTPYAVRQRAAGSGKHAG